MKLFTKLQRLLRSLTPAGRRKNAEPQIHPAHVAYLNDLRESFLAQSIPGTLIMLYLVAAVMIAGVVRAKFAKVEEVTQG